MSCSLKRQSSSAASVAAVCNGTPYSPVRVAAMFCTSPSAVNCLVSQPAPFCCLQFCSTQFLTCSTHPKLTHFHTTYCCPQNGVQFLYSGSFSVVYSKMINGAANYFFRKITTNSWFQAQFISVLAPLSTAHCFSQFVTAGAVLYRNVDCNLNCFSCCTLHEGRHLSSWLQRIL